MANPSPPVIGILGGSGLYQMEGLEDVTWRKVSTPFGEPSDELCFGTQEGTRVVFLPRHGRGHRLAPSDINFRANIDALKRVGVTDVLSLSAVGSLREDLPPGTFVVVDQFIDRTFARPRVSSAPGAWPTSPWPGRCARAWADAVMAVQKSLAPSRMTTESGTHEVKSQRLSSRWGRVRS